MDRQSDFCRVRLIISSVDSVSLLRTGVRQLLLLLNLSVQLVIQII